MIHNEELGDSFTPPVVAQPRHRRSGPGVAPPLGALRRTSGPPGSGRRGRRAPAEPSRVVRPAAFCASPASTRQLDPAARQAESSRSWIPDHGFP